MSKQLVARPRWIGSLSLSAALAGGLATAALQPSLRDTKASGVVAPVAAAPPPSVTVAVPPAPAETEPVAAEQPERSARFVVTVGGVAYVRLSGLEEDALPARRPAKLVEEGARAFVVTEVKPAAVPAAALAWKGATVIADETCRATAGEVVIISQLLGDPGYADAGERWTSAYVEEYGERFLAVRLDGCAGAELAREATAPRLIYPEALGAPRLREAAKRVLLASPAAAEAKREWAEFDPGTSWREQLKLDVRVLRHPTTGTTTVIAFATNDVQDCGTPTHNLLGVFAVGADGELVPGPVRAVDELHELERVIDLDGDGTFELTGRPWLGMDRVWVDGDGQVLERLNLPFYGCPC
ncbi:MAG: hypothetical protein R3B48_03360 [Kofleriaceae bacterium]